MRTGFLLMTWAKTPLLGRQMKLYEIIKHARVWHGRDFFYMVAVGLEDAKREGRINDISAIDALVQNYQSIGDSIPPPIAQRGRACFKLISIRKNTVAARNPQPVHLAQ
jgi:hypothetical protein